MKEKKNCKIIQDLLPNYIEKLTKEETNSFIEEHLKECEECNSILEKLQKDINIDTNKINKKQVNYLKKYNKKMKTLKSMLLIIVLIFIIVIGRKTLLLTTLSEKANKNINRDNYYARLSQYEGTTILITETYKKGQKQKNIQTYYDSQNNEHNSKLIEYLDNNTTKLYTELNNEKIAILDGNSAMLLPMKVSESYSHYSTTIWKLIKNTVFSSINKAKCNGRDCYYFSSLETDMMGISEVGSGIYIDEETGLPIRTTSATTKTEQGISDPIIEFYYEFDSVTDDDIKEPDISQYTIQH